MKGELVDILKPLQICASLYRTRCIELSDKEAIEAMQSSRGRTAACQEMFQAVKRRKDNWALLLLEAIKETQEYVKVKMDPSSSQAQNQVIEEKAAALHHTMPKLFSRSMEKECHQTMRKIQTLDSMVNKINVMVNIFGSEENVELFDDTELVMEDNKRILIPVFMQLDIPTSWDKTKVFEAIDEFRLTGTPDMNIRIKAISIDDLSMYAEIAKQVLGNVHELRSEINKLMSTMLSDAEIDTMENAELCVNLNVPDRSVNQYFCASIKLS
ncbi:unnamed protein product [Mytilus edulis]|uniref:Caspase recruitment domain-containing protein n=1 Tax=Mytilus edulis TaxID=6550 RepID=A0A8S3TFM4_MYTED|nr:unnamed protein product [Mytilus edulis]